MSGLQHSDHGRSLPVADATTVRRAAGDLVRGNVRGLAGVVLLNALAAGAGLAAPWLLGRIVNLVQSGEATTGRIDLLAAAIVGFGIAQILLLRHAVYAAFLLGERVLSQLRTDFVDQMLALPTAGVERAGTGDLMTRSSGDVATVGIALRNAAPEIFISMLQVLFILGAVLVLEPLLGLCAMVGLPVAWLVARWYLARARTAYLDEGSTSSDLAEELAATTDGARTVEALRLGVRRVESGDARIAAAYAARVRTLFLRSVLFPVVDVAHVIPVTLILLVGGFGYLHGWTSLGTVVSATLYVWLLVDPVDRIMMWLEQLQRGIASLARLTGIGQVVAPTRPPVAEPAGDRLELEHVRFAYEPGRDVLHGIDLTVQPGERVAVVGPSGAGKSTLGRLIAGLDAPRTGQATVGGVRICDLEADKLHRRVLLVTQEHHVFLASLRENLAIAAPSATGTEMTAALDAVGADWLDELPDGLDTDLGAGAFRLDAAQAQQLALARVLLADPRTVILDEATALLSPAAARRAERAMAAVLEGRTVIAIAHRLHTAHDADRVVVVEDGRITEDGSHLELVTIGGAYSALWRSWHGSGHGGQPEPL